MFGEDVWRLTVTAQQGSSVTVLFQKEGNYGDNWNYGQATLNITVETVVSSRTNGLKGIVHPKNENSVINYKPVIPSFIIFCF